MGLPAASTSAIFTSTSAIGQGGGFDRGDDLAFMADGKIIVAGDVVDRDVGQGGRLGLFGADR